jgi:hypothetical protein
MKINITAVGKLNGQTYHIIQSNTVNCSSSKINRMKKVLIEQINEVNKVNADTPIIIQHDGYLEKHMNFYQSLIKAPHFIGSTEQVIHHLTEEAA